MNIALLGCGNMAQALFLPLAHKNGSLTFHTYTPSQTRAIEFAKNSGGKHYKKIKDIPPCDFYVLACKPQQLCDLAKMMPTLPNKAIVLSLLAATSVARLKKELGEYNFVRLMPNTPSRVNHGVCALFCSSHLDKEKVTKLLSPVAKVYQFENEETIDLITPVCGCGPAYLFEIADILIADLKNIGLDKELAHKIVADTLYGSAKMLRETTKDATSLKDQVASKGGVTEEALTVLEQKGLRDVFGSALSKARARIEEMLKNKY